ncbi:MAG: SCP2 sterol-binding domain-containing protein [Myxococcales bacterium]|nr:SCP2 sterol-binding domain-containing protein [Myxococcales bacterium]
MPDAKHSFETDIPNRINADVEKAKAIGAIFLFTILGDEGGVWTVNLRDDPGVSEGDAGNSECALEMSHEDWKTISDNPSAAMPLFFQGKLKVSGNTMLATKLQQLLG